MSRARAFCLLGLMAAFIAAVPVLIAVLGIRLADEAGCAVTEASVQSCIIFGYELKDPIYAVVLLYQLLYYTILYVPIAIALLIAAFVTRRKRGGGNMPCPTVGLQFWVISAGLLILPLFTYLALLLMSLAALDFAIGRWRSGEHRGSTTQD
jgi:hypothetical protein